MIDYSRCLIPVLQGELKSRRLPFSGTKSALLARLRKSSENAYFVHFPRLPPNLRERIWNLALPRRIIAYNLGDQYELKCRIPFPAAACRIRRANKEALGVVGRYQPNPELLKETVPSWPAISKAPNFHDDIFHISNIDGTIHAFERNGRNLDQIKSVAFNVKDIKEGLSWKEADSLLQLVALEEIIIIEDFRPLPFDKKITKHDWMLGISALGQTPIVNPPRFLAKYNDTATPRTQSMADSIRRLIAEKPEYKKFEHVKIFFAQLQFITDDWW